jgi:hypothetical protein
MNNINSSIEKLANQSSASINVNPNSTISVRKDPTFARLQRLGDLGDSYDSVVTKLLDIGEKKLLSEAWEEVYIVNTQK